MKKWKLVVLCALFIWNQGLGAGGEQGNPLMRHFENPILGVAFDYPFYWETLGADFMVSLMSRSQTSLEDNPSHYSVVRLLRQDLTSLEDLKAYLSQKYPNNQWSSTTHQGIEGFHGISKTQDTSTSLLAFDEFYFQEPNIVIGVHYEASLAKLSTLLEVHRSLSFLPPMP